MMMKRLKIARIRALAFFARRSPYLAQRWGFTGILAAEGIDESTGRRVRVMLGEAIAIEQIRRGAL